MSFAPANHLADITRSARSRYAELVGSAAACSAWWTAIVLTAGSARQADRYRWEIQRRLDQGKLPASAQYLVVPDPDGCRIGSGGATLNALRALAQQGLTDWARQRILILHSGGDSRRLPQYSPSGKLFTALPVKTPWGEVSTVFDEMLALSLDWAQQLPAGVLVGSGDVLLTFDAAALDWSLPGVCGVAMRQPVSVGARHGVYVLDERGRVYAFLQKPSLAEVRAAGGLLDGDQVALDIGLLRFCPETATRLAAVAESFEPGAHPPPAIDLYQHFTRTLTGQWSPGEGDPPVLHRLARALQGLPFWCTLVSGDFTHVGTTTLFRDLITGRTDFAGLYAVHQRLGAADMPGVTSAGVVVDSVLSPGSEIGPGAVVIECHFDVSVRLARGAVAHGLESLDEPLEIPEDTVVHKLPILLPDGRRGVAVRVYGVADDPKVPADSAAATWLGRPILDEVRSLGLDPLAVWPALPREQWTLWNAALFPVAPPADAWACARWFMRVSGGFDVQRWAGFERVSLAASSQWADSAALAASQARRLQANWVSAAVALAASESDLRPLLASAPGLGALAQTARRLLLQARALEESAPVTAASRHYQAGLFFAQAGLENDAGQARQHAFALVSRGVALGTPPHRQAGAGAWKHSLVSATAPARIDLGGGWSDTPPFCLDWGGAVLNVAVALNGEHPIRTLARTLALPVIRCVSAEDAQTVEYRSAADLLQPAGPGDPFAIHRCALQLSGLFDEAGDLTAVLERLGGGLELRTEVNLPMGSGLGTSSILAATVLRALAGLRGLPLSPQQLSDDVMVLEQRMSTGGGWQDQAGGIFPGAKLVTSGPGLRQRLRVQPVAWARDREAEFESLTLLYYTGIRRIARDLLHQVVGSYLARESAAFQVLHSIKTLAMEMACAMSEGDWDYLGRLLDRHWALNLLLDPNTTNAPINALLHMVRPYIRGAKLAGAGGGGFLILLSRGPMERDQLRALLADYGKDTGGALYDWRIARDGLKAEPSGLGD